jgi:hypothetical protein
MTNAFLRDGAVVAKGWRFSWPSIASCSGRGGPTGSGLCKIVRVERG